MGKEEANPGSHARLSVENGIRYALWVGYRRCHWFFTQGAKLNLNITDAEGQRLKV